MNNKSVDIYVGRTNSALVLKYPAGLEKKDICRYLQKDEEPSKTAYYLKLEFKDRPVNFHLLIDADKSHGIRPVDEGELEKLAKAFSEAKLWDAKDGPIGDYSNVPFSQHE